MKAEALPDCRTPDLSLLTPSHVLEFYRDAYRECALERKPCARAIQQLVAAWKILRGWNWQ